MVQYCGVYKWLANGIKRSNIGAILIKLDQLGMECLVISSKYSMCASAYLEPPKQGLGILLLAGLYELLGKVQLCPLRRLRSTLADHRTEQ